MADTKNDLSRYWVKLMMVIVVIIALGGYGLFYQSQKRLAQKESEYLSLKQKFAQTEDNTRQIQKQLADEAEKTKQAIQSCESTMVKNEALQIQYNALMKSHEQLLTQLKASSNNDTNTTPPTTDSTSTEHPVKHLNSIPSSSQIAGTPPTNATAVKPENSPSNESKNLMTQCPTPEVITQQASKGNWQDNQISWQVDFSSRPLNDNENVNQLKKMMYDGQSIACYYVLGPDDGTAWMVVKGNNKDHKAITLGKVGWTPCSSSEDCQQWCSPENIANCRFKIQD